MSRRSVNHWQKWLISQRRASSRNLAKLSRNAGQNTNQGFALPMALGMGLIMLLVGVTMILRSQDDQVTASAQKATARALGTAETGTARLQTFLNKYRYLNQFSSTMWNNTTVLDGAVSEYIKNSRCVTPPNPTTVWNEIKAASNDLYPGWKLVDSSDTSKGQFRLQSYTYNVSDRTGTAIIDSKTTQEAYTTIRVTIPIQDINNSDPRNDLPPSGLWLNISNLTRNQTVRGSLLLNGCSDDPNAPKNIDGTASPTRQSDIERDSGTLTVSPIIRFPNLPALPRVAPVSLSTPPTQDYYIGRYNPDLGSAATVPSTLPTANDIRDYPHGTQRDGSYAYRLSSITSGLKITSGKKVTIYLTGNINIGGNTKVNPPDKPPDITGSPGNLKIFGSNDGIYCPNGLPAGTASGCNTTRVSLSGASELRSYLFAPGATAGLKGGGNSERYFGAIWVNQWDMNSSSNKIAVGQQIVDWEQFLNWDGMYLSANQLAPISSWQRQQASN